MATFILIIVLKTVNTWDYSYGTDKVTAEWIAKCTTAIKAAEQSAEVVSCVPNPVFFQLHSSGSFICSALTDTLSALF